MSEPKKITELFAWVAHEPDGGEGVMAFLSPDGWVPLIGGDAPRIDSMRSVAHDIAAMRGVPYSLRRFAGMEVLVEYPAPAPVAEATA